MIKLIKSTFYKEKETKRKLIKFIKPAKKLSFGSECEKFEQNFAKYQGRKHAVFLNSGSSANLAIIQVFLNLKRIKRGDKVGFSAVTWSTNVMPLIQLGLRAIPIDVELDTLNISSRKLKEIMKKHRLRALFLTNLLGFCDDIDRIKKICQQNNIILIEDNCESLGTIYKGRKLGNFGVASTFSFYVGHHLSTVEGGMVCTDDREIANMLRIVRTHGWHRNLELKIQNKLKKEFKIESDFFANYTFYDLGYNFRPTEIQGYLGSIQLGYIKEINQRRNRNFLKLVKFIYKKTDKYYPIRFDHIDFVSNFAFPVVCKTEKLKDKIIKKCEGQIEIRPIVGGDITKQPFFQKYQKEFIQTINPNASIIHGQGLYFGNNPELTDKEIKKIITIF